MAESADERSPGIARVVVEILLLLLGPPLLLGGAMVWLSGGDAVVHAALVGGAIGLILAKLRREVYGLVDR